MQACAFICDTCLTPCIPNSDMDICGTDNMTIIIVAILHGQTQAEWMEWMSAWVKTNIGRCTPSTIPQVYGGLKSLQHPTSVATDYSLHFPNPE